jgi:hypothetical protein
MSVTIEFTDEEFDGMLTALYENLPEASGCSALRCVDWSYTAFKFVFLDEETGKEHRVNKEQAVEGLRKMLHDAAIGKIKMYSRDDWDADTTMCAVQYAIFGEEIYG